MNGEVLIYQYNSMLGNPPIGFEFLPYLFINLFILIFLCMIIKFIFQIFNKIIGGIGNG